MTVNWLIDAEMFEGYRDDLVAAIRAQGHDAKLVQPPQPPYRWEDVQNSYRRAFPPDSCVLTVGDIEFVLRIGREERWTPGVFAAIANFACSSYYCEFGKYLLNDPYVMLPFGELGRRREFLFDVVGRNGRVFIRPDSPLKLFTGQIATSETFDADLEFMGFYEFPRDSLVVVSGPHDLDAEWRFVVANRQVVAGSQYKQAGEMSIQPEFDSSAFELAGQIASENYQPDPVWVLDVCRTRQGAYRLLEIGGFSFADLYACDKQRIVAAASDAALAAWRQGREQTA
jgi:hypothetical protein